MGFHFLKKGFPLWKPVAMASMMVLGEYWLRAPNTSDLLWNQYRYYSFVFEHRRASCLHEFYQHRNIYDNMAINKGTKVYLPREDNNLVYFIQMLNIDSGEIIGEEEENETVEEKTEVTK